MACIGTVGAGAAFEIAFRELGGMFVFADVCALIGVSIGNTSPGAAESTDVADTLELRLLLESLY